MIQRCTNPNDDKYSYYGERGIRVCKRWHTFRSFFADMGQRPKHKVLDRIDPNGSYTPSNCRWATKRMSARNISHGAKLTREQVREIRSLLKGRNGAEIARRFGISRSHISNIRKKVRWG
jgi:DNA-binding CsgD family transcriptional regulator